MTFRTQTIHFLLAITISLNANQLVVARGGNGGGHGGGGGFHGGPGFAGRPGGPGFHGYGGYRGFRGGYPGRYYGWGPGYGWGYPYGAGLGLGLGLGLGYGLAAGYSYPYGYGYGYGYPAYGYGYSGYGYSGATYASPAAYNATATPAASNTVVTATAPPPEPTTNPSAAREFIDRGDTAFRAANYDKAAYSYRHAIVDDPRDATVLLKLAQALFAIGKYDEAAGATQAAMRQLPKDEWGSVVTAYQELYGNPQDYTRQLRVLEAAINKKPGDPAMRFLAGYHYGYLGFLKQSIEQLDKAIQSESRDEVAKQLRDEIKSKLIPKQNPSLVPPMSLPPVPSPDQ